MPVTPYFTYSELYRGQNDISIMRHYMLSSKYRYSWCRGYRGWKWIRKNKFKSMMRLLVFYIELIIFTNHSARAGYDTRSFLNDVKCNQSRPGLPMGKVWIRLFSFKLLVNSRADWLFNKGMANGIIEWKLWIQIF